VHRSKAKYVTSAPDFLMARPRIDSKSGTPRQLSARCNAHNTRQLLLAVNTETPELEWL
jgi:hypothetical protein